MIMSKEIHCRGCGAEITWAPVVKRYQQDARRALPEVIHYYCCLDCLEGRGCDCGQRMEIEDERRKGAVVGE